MAVTSVDVANTGDALRLAEVERCIASGVPLLRFSDDIEREYFYGHQQGGACLGQLSVTIQQTA